MDTSKEVARDLKKSEIQAAADSTPSETTEPNSSDADVKIGVDAEGQEADPQESDADT